MAVSSLPGQVFTSPPDEKMNYRDVRSSLDQSLNESRQEAQCRNSSIGCCCFRTSERTIRQNSPIMKVHYKSKVGPKIQLQSLALPNFSKSVNRHPKENKENRRPFTPASTPDRFPQSIIPQIDDVNQHSFLLTVQGIFNKVRKGRTYGYEYSHKNHVSENTYQLNCYGFVCYAIRCFFEPAYEELLTRMAQIAQESIPRSVDGIPCPFNFAAIFKKADLKYWRHIQRLEDIQAGDIMTYLPQNYVPSDFGKSIKKKGRTFTHVMIVDKVFNKTAKGVFHFSIIDCTRKPHSKTDTRQKEWMKTNGIGQAELFMKKKEGEDDFYTLQWKGGKRLSKSRELIVGRIIPSQGPI